MNYQISESPTVDACVCLAKRGYLGAYKVLAEKKTRSYGDILLDKVKHMFLMKEEQEEPSRWLMHDDRVDQLNKVNRNGMLDQRPQCATLLFWDIERHSWFKRSQSPESMNGLLVVGPVELSNPSFLSSYRAEPADLGQTMFSKAYLTILLVGTVASAAPLHLEGRALPTPIAASTARTYLSQLTVATDSNSPAYDRDLFKTWDTISGSCDTRETVLKRDGTSVVTNSDCSAASGKWVSPYDGVTTTDASSFDIDHLVPLKEAWVSGARSWTSAQREAFANDLTRPQLLAVSASSNRSKGDKDIAEWLPPLASYHCIYTRAWVQVKHQYGLTVDSAEKAAISSILSGC
ncbi:hypothetical protein NP233_g48 [Leucocoprinus birnbaumii]|uniref:GmrSD restriction endonucleases C-terminal domain-containing protein n=1 Tax=Leucocoprinus birnbaumii TaxID=56174 RepID=A0AAD5YX26_9AGAR|nr:hypothetical protein NP233_g48 [Leucocoprinus birnbaumii]